MAANVIRSQSKLSRENYAHLSKIVSKYFQRLPDNSPAILGPHALENYTAHATWLAEYLDNGIGEMFWGEGKCELHILNDREMILQFFKAFVTVKATFERMNRISKDKRRKTREAEKPPRVWVQCYDSSPSATEGVLGVNHIQSPAKEVHKDLGTNNTGPQGQGPAAQDISSSKPFQGLEFNAVNHCHDFQLLLGHKIPVNSFCRHNFFAPPKQQIFKSQLLGFFELDQPISDSSATDTVPSPILPLQPLTHMFTAIFRLDSGGVCAKFPAPLTLSFDEFLGLSCDACDLARYRIDDNDQIKIGISAWNIGKMVAFSGPYREMVWLTLMELVALMPQSKVMVYFRDTVFL